MTEEQAERLIREVRLLRTAVWTGLIVAGCVLTIHNLLYRPAPPPVVSVPIVGGR